jgi:hypothetical protein
MNPNNFSLFFGVLDTKPFFEALDRARFEQNLNHLSLYWRGGAALSSGRGLGEGEMFWLL